ncbi:MAG: serine hydrolase [Patescibacteria group bacterium]|mgnify:CR=1 FL=1
MIKFQSLILILVILISVLIFRISDQKVEMAQTGNFYANISAVVANSEINQGINQEQESVPESIKPAVQKESGTQQQEGDYNQDEDIPSINTSQPVIHSHIASAKYLDSNLNFFELNINKRWPIASLTKLMTAVIVVEKSELNRQIIIDKDTFKFKTNGLAGGFASGEIFTAEDLINAMLVVSSNDAAVALAESISPEFVKLMNQKAVELNMTETNFDDPTGLSFLNQSTVNDLAKLMNYIYYNHPQIFEITRQKEAVISELNSGVKRKLININQFAGQSDFIGGKTGYTEAADENLMSLFNKQGRLILITVLGSKDRFGDTEKLLELIK